MPFKRCVRCGKDFLARDDAQRLCSDTCTAPRRLDDFEDLQPGQGTSWRFPLMFLVLCVVTVYCHVYAHSVQFYLVNHSPVGRAFFASRLAAGGAEAFPFILEGVRDSDLEVARIFLAALGSAVVDLPADDPLRQELIEELTFIWHEEEDPILRAEAVSAMAFVPDRSFEPILLEALRDPSLRQRAVISLRAIGTARCVPFLTDIVEDRARIHGEGDLRYQTVITLGIVLDDDARALPSLTGALSDPSGPLRHEILVAIARIAERYDSLTMSGRQRVRDALVVLRRRRGSDPLFHLRDVYEETIRVLEGVVD